MCNSVSLVISKLDVRVSPTALRNTYTIAHVNIFFALLFKAHNCVFSSVLGPLDALWWTRLLIKGLPGRNSF